MFWYIHTHIYVYTYKQNESRGSHVVMVVGGMRKVLFIHRFSLYARAHKGIGKLPNFLFTSLQHVNFTCALGETALYSYGHLIPFSLHSHPYHFSPSTSISLFLSSIYCLYSQFPVPPPSTRYCVLAKRGLAPKPIYQPSNMSINESTSILFNTIYIINK